MALRHPWFSQPLKRKCPDDHSSAEGSGGFECGGGFGVVGTVYGGLTTNAYNTAQVSQPNQTSNPNGRATKRIRKSESRNLERGFAELSIQPTPSASPSPTQVQPQPLEQQLDTQVGGDGVWSNVVGDVGQSSSVLCPDGSTLPLLRSSSVSEPPSPEVADIQMSNSTWYEPEKDRIIITSLDDDEYDGDDEGQQRPRSETKPTAQESEFTISPAFLNAINKKLTRSVNHPAPPLTDTSTTQALVLFRPLPAIAPPPTNGELEDCSHKEGELDRSPQKPFPSESPFFYVQDSEPPSFVPNDDAMEIEML